jgi:hypothetical protein
MLTLRRAVKFHDGFWNAINTCREQILQSCDRASWQTLTIKPTRCNKFPNLFWNENLQVSDSSSVHYQVLFAIHSAMVYVIQVCKHIPLLRVQWINPDDGQRNCPKHVEFHFQSKFEKLVYLVGFIIRMHRTSYREGPRFESWQEMWNITASAVSRHNKGESRLGGERGGLSV